MEGISVVPAVVPVDVFIRNTSETLLDVIFAAPTIGGIADGDRGRYWAGDVAMSLRSIPPGAQRCVCLTAVLTEPGTYNLSKFTILYQSSAFTHARTRTPWMLDPSYLVVTDSSRTVSAGAVKAVAAVSFDASNSKPANQAQQNQGQWQNPAPKVDALKKHKVLKALEVSKASVPNGVQNSTLVKSVSGPERKSRGRGDEQRPPVSRALSASASAGSKAVNAAVHDGVWEVDDTDDESGSD